MSGDKYANSEPFYPPMRPETIARSRPPPAGLPNGIPNPLSLFQSKSKPIYKDFRSTDVTVGLNVKEIEANSRWLRPDKVDPKFGLEGDTKEVLIRRSYRRLESTALFNPVKNVSLEELALEVEKAGRFDVKRYVLVEESRLAELAALETILREEKARLGEQCAWIMNDYHVDARIPLPATRIAVQNLCTAEAARLQEEITNIHVAWQRFRLKNNYDRLDEVLNTKSYIGSAPLALRALKLQKLHEMRGNKLQQFERDSMLFEDDLSFLNGAHYRALERRLDYDRYFVLATRYGHFSEMEYAADDRPGRRYWLRCIDGALKFQGVWGMYWAIQRVKRRRGATLFQKIARGWIYYRRWHPLVIFRLKYGKRTYYEFVLSRWKSYNRILKMCKESIAWHLDRTWFHKCWAAWRKFASESVAERNRLLRRVLYGLINAGLVKTFQALKRNAVRNRYIKIKMRRAIGFPHFDMWCDYVDFSKTIKKINKAGTRINAKVRMFLLRKKFKAKRVIGIKLGIIMRAIVKCIRIRKSVLAENFLLWEMQETEALAILNNEVESKRLQRQLKAVEARESASMGDLKRHLKSKYGRVQLQQSAKHVLLSSSKQVIIDDTQKKMVEEFAQLLRQRERHDFNIKDPAKFTCVDPNCGATFISQSQYYNHWRNDIRHANNNRLDESYQFYGHDPRMLDNAKIGHDRKRRHAYPAPVVSSADMKSSASAAEYNGMIKIVDFHILLQCEAPVCKFRESLQALMRAANKGGDSRKTRLKDSLDAKPMTPMNIESSANAGSGMESASGGVQRSSVISFMFTPKISPASPLQQLDEENDENDENEDNKAIVAIEGLAPGDSDEVDPYYKNMCNVLDLYTAIAEWRKYPSTSKEFASKAIQILDRYIKAPPSMIIKEPSEEDMADYWENYDLDGYNTDDSDDTVLGAEKAQRVKNREAYMAEQQRRHEIAMRGENVVDLPHEDEEWWSWMIDRLTGVRHAQHRGFYVSKRLPRTCIRAIFGMQGQQYNEWSTEAVLPANIFDRLQWVAFRFLFYFCNEKYPDFPNSAEMEAFREVEKAKEERRLQEMYWRAKDVRLQKIEKWVHNVFMDQHLRLYRLAEKSAIVAHEQICDSVVDKAISACVGQLTWYLGYEEQARHESTKFLAHETCEWVFDNLFDEIYRFYGYATVASLLDISEVRHRMMMWAGLKEREVVLSKKLLVNVDMKASSASMLDMLHGGNDDDHESELDAAQSETQDANTGNGGVSESKVSDSKKEALPPKKPSITSSRKAPGMDPGPAPKPSQAAIAEMKKTQEEQKNASQEGPVPEGNVINASNHKSRKSKKIAGGAGSVPGDSTFHISPKELSSLKRIQTFGRKVLARNRVRRIFVKTFVKKWDPTYGAVFYANVKDGSSSWEPPKLYKQLFPGKSW